MRLLLAGTLAATTAAGLALIRPAVLTDEEGAATRAIRAGRIRADVRFLSSDELEGRAPGSQGDRLVRAYLSSRLEAIGLVPGGAGGSWEQAVDSADASGERRRSANVLGLLPGRDPVVAREAVVYSASHAARDDASALGALLAVAEAFASLPERPRRSILFAAVAGEGRDLPGSTHLARNPPAPVERFVAHIELDGALVQGRVRDLPVVGLGRSSLDDWIRALAEAQGRTVAPEAFVDEGARRRAGHLGFDGAGIPAARLGAEAVEDGQLAFLLGVKVADAPVVPGWRAGEASDPAPLTADGRR